MDDVPVSEPDATEPAPAPAADELAEIRARRARELAPVSRRAADQERRATKQPRPRINPAHVRVYGDPTRILCVEIEGKMLPCWAVNIERSAQDQGFLVLKIALPHVDLDMRATAGRLVIQPDDEEQPVPAEAPPAAPSAEADGAKAA